MGKGQIVKVIYILLAGVLLSSVILAARKATHRTALLESASVSPIAPDSVPPLERGRTVPDAVLVNQEGRPFRLSTLRGQIVVTAFIYTRCTMPQMCPLTVDKLVAAQKTLQTLGVRNVHFLAVSFDTRDTPESLKAFAARFHPDLASFSFATGRHDEIALLSHTLSTYFQPGKDGVIEHNIAVSIIDGNGTLRYNFFGTDWTVKEMADTVKQVSNTKFTASQAGSLAKLN